MGSTGSGEEQGGPGVEEQEKQRFRRILRTVFIGGLLFTVGYALQSAHIPTSVGFCLGFVTGMVVAYLVVRGRL